MNHKYTRSLQRLVVIVIAVVTVNLSVMADDGEAKYLIPFIGGGDAISVTSAPWQAWVQMNDGAFDYYCGGAVLDTTHVLTAGHCAFNTAGVPFTAAQVSVTTGISAFDPVTWFTDPQSGDVEQDATVSAIRVHPYYSWASNPMTDAGFADDVAVLTLHAPLSFDSDTTAVALPTAGATIDVGSAAVETGFGSQSQSSAVGDGKLHGLNMVIQDAFEATDGSNALWIAATGGGSSCSGDSGGPLVQPGTPTRLIGIISHGTACSANSDNYFVNVAAPEIFDFLAGSDAPPRAPRGGGDVDISAASYVEPSASLTCSAGTWTGDPAFTYQFVDSATKAVLQVGPSNVYQVKTGDVGARIFCKVIANNAGGTGVGASQRSFAVNSVSSFSATPDFALRVAALKRASANTLEGTLKVKNIATFTATDIRVCLSATGGAKFTRAMNGGEIASNRKSECWIAKSLRPQRILSLKFQLARGRQSRKKKFKVGVDGSVESPNANSASNRWQLRK